MSERGPVIGLQIPDSPSETPPGCFIIERKSWITLEINSPHSLSVGFNIDFMMEDGRNLRGHFMVSVCKADTCVR